MISDSYKKQLEQLHKENEDWGTGPRGNIISICHWLYMNNIYHELKFSLNLLINFG